MDTQLTLSRNVMLEQRQNRGSQYDGQYIVGIRTTGIYCLPSCRPPKMANAENVEFYATPQAARAAGLRACKLCRPDDFYLGHHAGEALIEALVDRVSRNPERFSNVQALINNSGVGSSKLHELFRVHYHTTPLELLTRKRIAAARRLLLHSERQVVEIAFEVGFESLSAFNTNFRKHSAMSPAKYRQLNEPDGFELMLPRQYPAERMLAYLGRDSRSLAERVCGNTYIKAFRIGADPVVVQVELGRGRAHCQVISPASLDVDEWAELHDRLLATLGLVADPLRFEAQVLSSPELASLVVSQRGLRIPLVADPFEALIWAIIGEQTHTECAGILRRRLVERVSYPVAAGLYLPPSPEMVATLEPKDLVRMGFTDAKAACLTGTARSIVDGRLPLDELAGAPATRIERTLRGVRGIGPWSVHYLMMRSFGFLDCVPVGDAGLMMGLKQLFALDERPGNVETLALMSCFSPYRSLATFHLWQRFGSAA